MNMLLHVEAGTFCIALYQGLVYIFHLVEDIFVRDNLAQGGNLVSPIWLVMVYVVLTLGELMLSPIGLSMITKLAPPKLVSVVMGLWMASFAAGNYLAGVLEGILETFELSLYPFISMVMLISAILLLALSPLLNKAMKGIH